MNRLLYRLLLRLHPRAFRERFAQEMLWIFDESHQPASFLLDALFSLLRQHARGEAAPQPAIAGFGLLDAGPGITPRRIVEASITATLFLAAMLLLLAHPPKAAVLPACLPGAPRPAAPPLHAPTRIHPLAATAAHLQTQTGPTQVDNAVAGALQVLRAPSNPQPTGYCAAP